MSELLEAGLFSFLSNSPTVAAYVGGPASVPQVVARIYPLKLEQPTKYPALSYHVVTGEDEIVLNSGTPNIGFKRVQISVWSESVTEAKTIIGQLRLLLSGFRGNWDTVPVSVVNFASAPDMYDHVAKVFHCACQMGVWYQEGLNDQTYYEDFVSWPDQDGALCGSTRWAVQQDSPLAACMFTRLFLFGSQYVICNVSITSEPEGNSINAYRAVGFATLKSIVDDWPKGNWTRYKVSTKLGSMSPDSASTLFPGRTLGGPMIQFNGSTGNHSADGIAAIYESTPPAAPRLALVHYYGNYVISVLASANQTLNSNQVLSVEHNLLTGKINLYVDDVLKLQTGDSGLGTPGKAAIFAYFDGSWPVNSAVKWYDFKTEILADG